MFENSWKEKLGNVEKFVKYVTKRGGAVIIPNVAVESYFSLSLIQEI